MAPKRRGRAEKFPRRVGLSKKDDNDHGRFARPLALPDPSRVEIGPVDKSRHRVPTAEERRLVETAAGYGLTTPQIGELVDGGVSAGVIDRHFKEELRRGRAIRMLQVVQKLHEKIDEGNVASILFYLKCRGGWKESRHEAPVEDEEEAITEIRRIVIDAHAEPAKVRELVEAVDRRRRGDGDQSDEDQSDED